MEYINQKYLKNLAWKIVTIEKVYPAYRKWFNPNTKKPEKFVEFDWAWHQETRENGERKLEKKEPNFKDHKKLYDIVVTLDENISMNVDKYNKDMWASELVTINDNKFTFQELWAKKIRDIAEATVAFGNIPQKEDGTPAYDWEDGFIGKLSWVTIMFSTKNAKKDFWNWDVEFAEFTFKEAKKPTADDDLPFS